MTRSEPSIFSPSFLMHFRNSASKQCDSAAYSSCRRSRQCGDEIRNQRTSRRPVRISADRRNQRPQFFATSTVDPLERNQYGGVIGGPVVKNRVFFSADTRAQRSDSNRQPVQFLMTAALNGDFRIL